MKFIYAIMLLAFTLVGCNDSDNGGQVTGQTVTLDLKFKVKTNTQNTLFNNYVAMTNGDSLLISRLDFYVDEMEFIDRQGKSVKNDNVFLYSLEQPSNVFSFKSDKLPSTIQKIRFLTALDSATNQEDPLQYFPDHPLSDRKKMWWSMSTDYRYVIIEGRIKSSSQAQPYTFAYHTGLTYFAFTELMINKTLQASGANEQEIVLDLEKVFFPAVSSQNIKYTQGELFAHGHAMDGPLTDKVAKNFAAAFSVQ